MSTLDPVRFIAKNLRVDLVLYAVLVIYFWLIGYELWMLQHAGGDLSVL